MQTPRSTRSSVLGKRSHQPDTTPTSRTDKIVTPPTPDLTPNPKRPRTSGNWIDGDGNKENVPPEMAPESPPTSARAIRALRRTNTESTPSTPSRTRTTSLRRRASTSSVSEPVTPATAISNLTLSTPPPTPPPTLIPIYARARALLRPICNYSLEQIAGRDSERAIIHNFLTTFISFDSSQLNSPSTLYISGSPGTGKTALVNSILLGLAGLDPSSIKVITINCMALNDVEALWERIIEEIGSENDERKISGRVKKATGKDAVSVLMSGVRTKFVLVLDELDHIASSQTALDSLFSLPHSHSSTLRIIGIANTHTLTSSASSVQTSSSGVKTLHFAPYTPTQLLAIIQTRLKPLYEDAPDGQPQKFLPCATLTLLTKKIAAQTGDVRSLFEVLRGAIDLALHQANVDTDENPMNTPCPTVTPTHILAALKAYTPTSVSTSSAVSAGSNNSEIVTKICNLGLQARLVLLCILLATTRLTAGLPLVSSASKSPVKRTSSASQIDMELDMTQLHTYYTTLLRRGGTDSEVFIPVSRSEFGDLAGVLEGVGLISLSGLKPPTKGGKRAFGRSASFAGGASKKGGQGQVKLEGGVRANEVLRGMGIDSPVTSSGDIRDEEVRAIWEREKTRLSRDRKVKDAQLLKEGYGGSSFEGAMED